MPDAIFKSPIRFVQLPPSTTARYTWYRSWHSPFESLWSLLQKFSVLNQCSATDIRRIFGRTGRHCAPYIWNKTDVNLANVPALNANTLRSIFHLTDQKISEATVVWYLRPHERQLASQQRLRICPECYRNGFHSALYQLRLLENCPSHNIPLLEVCPSCAHPLPLYDLCKEAFDSPYQCEHCMTVWWANAYQGRRDPGIARMPDPRLQKLGEWLQRRKAIPTLESEIYSSLRLTSQQLSRLTGRLQRHACHWGNLHGIPAPEEINRSVDLAAHATIKRRNRGETDPAQDKKTWVLYKSVRRFLMRQVKRHRNCLRQLAKRLCTSMYLLEEPTPDICPEAYAIVFWRTHFERHEDPSRMFVRQLRRVGVLAWLNYNFSQHGDLAPWARQRIFAIDCLALFEESRRVARQAIADGVRAEYFLRADAITDWIAQEEGELTRLDWWKTPPGRMDTIDHNSPRMPFDSQ